MPVYLGTLGRMVKLPYVTSQQVDTEDRYSFQTTLEGRRKAQVKPVGRRTWALATQHFRPNEAALLSQFADGAWGSGPFVFVSADAPVTNLLTPDAVDCKASSTSGTTHGGPVTVSDGSWSPTSLLMNGAPTAYFDSIRYPVLAGRPVTFSADVMGAGARVAVSFFTAAGAFVSLVASPANGVAGVMRRLSVTSDVPATAVACQVAVQSAVQASRPQLTWTGSQVPFGAGQGCHKAVVHGLSSDLRLAVQGAVYSNLGFTVSEVG